jgi:hypothetical protein
VDGKPICGGDRSGLADTAAEIGVIPNGCPLGSLRKALMPAHASSAGY